MIKITNKKTNGHQEEYNPEVEFEYLDADVWIENNNEGKKSVSYSEDVMEKLEDNEEENPPENPNN